MRTPPFSVDTYGMVEYSMALDKGFQFGSMHGPAWVPIGIGVVALIVVWKIIGGFLRPSS